MREPSRRHDDDPPEPRRLRNLRWLVTALTATLILGVITITAMIVIRLAPGPAPIALPPVVTLPPGETATAVTAGLDWVAVVTRDRAGRERIRLVDGLTGIERSVTEIAPR